MATPDFALGQPSAIQTEETTRSSGPRIRLDRVSKSFAGRVVVDVDTLVLGEQPIEGLLGPNGAGKTTLMRLIMHSIQLDTGAISLVDHADRPIAVLSDLAPHQIARRGVVKSTQVITDFEQLTILDSLLLSMTAARLERPTRIFGERKVYDEHRDEIHRQLEFFELGDPMQHAQSAGQKKVLDIIRCLLVKPAFLLLDEPTAGLPDAMTMKVMTAIRDLAAEGTSVVVVEHDLNVIWELCDEVTFMAEGRVLMKDDPQSIRNNRTVIEKYLGEGHV